MPSPNGLLERIRELCLSFPEASEVSAWGHPVFRVRRKAFVAFEQVQARPSIAFRLDPFEVERLLERRKTFFATPYGRGLWVSVWIDRAVNEKLLEKLAREAYVLMAGKRLTALLDQSRREGAGSWSRSRTRPRYETAAARRTAGR